MKVLVSSLAVAIALGGAASESNTVQQARYKFRVPDSYGLSPEQQKTFNPIVRQCVSDLSSIAGFRKNDEWFDWRPINDPVKRSELQAICAAYHVGLADGINIGSASTAKP